MTISPAQSRMARAFLYMSQAEVAQSATIDQAQLSNFENPNQQFLLSYKPLQRLEQFYTSKGLEFLANDSVRRKAVGIIELKGYDGFKEFINDVYETVKNGGDICVSNVDERQFEHWQGIHANEYLSKMEKVKNLQFRVLVQKGDTYFTAKYAAYRALPSEYFTGIPAYVYGDKRAEILFEEDSVTVLIIENKRMAEAQRKLFELAWRQADDPI